MSVPARRALLGGLLASALILASVVSAGPSAAAQSSKLIHLTGVVEGPAQPGGGEGCPYPSKLALDEGDRPVGTVHFRSCLVSGPFERYHAWTKLTVGPLHGKAFLVIRFFDTAQGQEPYGEGHITQTAGAKTGYREGIKLKRATGAAPIATDDGAKVEVTLRPAGPFPSR